MTTDTSQPCARMPPPNAVARFPHGRRASRACSYCQIRKVRCSALRNSFPCTNCQLDGVDCKIRGKRKVSSRKTKSLYMPIPWAINAHQDWTASNPQSSPKNFVKIPPQKEKKLRRNQEKVSIEDPVQAHPITPPATTPEIKTKQTEYDHMQHNYIQCNPSHVDETDLSYLRKKGVFTIPQKDLRDALLKSYIDHVHPHLPMLDLNDLLWRIQKNNSMHCVSLLLFQTIMFAGTSFVDLQYLHRAGYQNRDSARRAFFHKTRLLYDFDMETDIFAIVNSLLLMSYWHDSPEEKGCRHWLEVGLSLAQRISLHRDPTKSSLSPASIKNRKRLWWCLYACDERVSQRTRREPLVSKGDYDVPTLTLDDFDLGPFRPELSIIGLDDSCYWYYHRDLAMKFIQRASSWPQIDWKIRMGASPQVTYWA